MYKITLKPNRDMSVITLHDNVNSELRLINPKLKLTLNKTGALTFSVPVTHPYYSRIAKMQCEISVYKEGTIIYVGRPLTSEDDFYRTSAVTCEGVLAYFIDSIQRPYSFTGSIKEFLSGVIANHNSQVDSYKQFTLGICDVVDENNYINRSDSGYTDSLSTINNKLIDTHGGYITVRSSSGTRYIDYKAQAGKKNTQVIKFAENIIDLNKYIKSENLITAIIPLGAETEEIGINDTKKRVTIASVNNGKDYIVDESAVQQFGYIYGVVEFDDVTLPSNLKNKAQKYLSENKNLSLTIELSAVDLSVLNTNIEAFNLGDSVRVISKPHNLDSYFVISEYELDLVDPSQNKITLGKSLAKLSQTVNKNQNDATIKLIKKTDTLNADIFNAVENATNLITGSTGGYLYIKKNSDGQPEELYILDAPSIDDAQNVIRLNKNGIGFSRTGYNGTFSNAWTIDGSLVADFITAGTLNASLIKTGKLMSSVNNKVYFDLVSGVLSGSVLVDSQNNSNLRAEFGTTTIDGVSYKGLNFYDSNNTDSNSEITNIGGIIRYQDNSTTNNIGLYSTGDLVLSGNGIAGEGSSMTLSDNRVYINRKIGANETFDGDTTTVFDANANNLTISCYQTSSQYAYLRLGKSDVALYQAYPPTTSGSTILPGTSCCINFERGSIQFLIGGSIIFEITSSGAKLKGVTVTSDRSKKCDIEVDESKKLDKIANLSTYKYKLINDDVQRYGFMADELPNEMLAEDKKSVDLYASLAVAVKAIQELNEKVKCIENEIKELKQNG